MKAVMVKHAININKTNNHLLPQITDHKKTTTSDDGNPCCDEKGTNM